MSQHWIPRYKWQLIEWVIINAGMKRQKANRMNRTELYAVFYNTLAK